MIRRPALMAATAAAAAVLAGCAASGHASSAAASPVSAPSSASASSSGSAPSSAAATAAPPASPPKTLAACSTGQLQASLGGGAGAGMSQQRTGIQLRNIGRSACTLYGYPGVSWVTGSDGRQAGLAAARQATAGSSSRIVTLAPGALASAALDIVEGDGGLPASQCHPVDARGLRVYPPGQRTALFIADPVQDPGVCSARTPQPMLSVGFLQSGVQPGNGGAG